MTEKQLNQLLRVLQDLAYEVKQLNGNLKSFDGFTGEIQSQLNLVAQEVNNLSSVISEK